MESILLLGAMKLVVDIAEGNFFGAVTGILLSGIPGSDLYTLGDSIYYLFDTDGNLLGKKDISGIDVISHDKYRFQNLDKAKSTFYKLTSSSTFERNQGSDTKFSRK